LDSKAAGWIAKLGLKEHPEGGYYRETFRSESVVDVDGYDGPRNISSAIYYLLVGNQASSFHKLKSDELWHWYAGGSLSMQIIRNDRLSKIRLGTGAKARPQLLVSKESWMAASIGSGRYCLVGCTVSPGFDFRDWELGKREELLKRYPQYKSTIRKYTTV
jgi:predicted cupin superfamily sugar epimerase